MTEQGTCRAQTTVEGDLRVWWIPQIPGKPFYVLVKTVQEAKLITETLADYDRFQFEHHIKPDYANAGGLQEFGEGDWSDWYDVDGSSFEEWCDRR